ncbi:MAG: sensor histidine kinase [Candidatus Sericytochromatia bacterium]
MKIRQRLTLWFAGLVTLIVGTGALLGWLGLRSYSYSLLRTELRDKQIEIQAFLNSLTHEFEQQHLSFNLRRNANSMHSIFVNDQTSLYATVFIQVSDLKGQPIARSDNLGDTLLPVFPLTSESSPVERPLLLDQDQVAILYASTPLLIKGRPQGLLQLAISMERIRHVLGQLLMYEIVVLLLSLLAALALGQVLAQRALEPMLKITRQVQQMAGQDPFQRLDTSHLSQDEIGILASTFNGLLQRIEAVFLIQQRFLADASHEFKTPLTAIRGHAQLLEKRGSNEAIRLKSAATIIRESRRLGRLVDDLLLLARLESQASHLTKLDLAELVAEVYEDLEPLHPSLQVRYHEQHLPILGNGDSLRRVLLNLLDNAFHALPGKEEGRVLLSCRRQGELAEILVSDSGQGIEAEHLPHLFERFYRVNRDRSRETGGSGIGLALVYEIVRLHQGSVEVASIPGQGTTITLRLPLDSKTSS